MLLAAAERALGAAEAFFVTARAKLAARVAPDGVLEPERLEHHQFAGHALAWIAASVEGLRQTGEWARRLDDGAAFGAADALILEIAYGEYVAQLAGGIPMAQGEFARPQDLGLTESETAPLRAGDAGMLAAALPEARLRLGKILAESGEGGDGGIGLDDATLDMIRDRVRRFAERAVMPFAQDWHRRDQLIPLPLIEELAGIGVFGLTIPEEFGGLGLGKTAMCVVSEELSRAYIGVGSLGTRSEIAAELLLNGGTKAQQEKYLPGIASGEILPTAVFTEPNTGSDLGSLRTRATRDGDKWKITGNKTWITHAAR